MATLLVLFAIHAIAAFLVVHRLRKATRWSPQQKAFAVFSCWALPLFGQLAVLAATLGQGAPPDSNLPHAVEQLQNHDHI